VADEEIAMSSTVHPGQLTTEEEARTVPCPVCPAGSEEPCIAHGGESPTSHVERRQYYRNLKEDRW
jgi:hypothetical protein